MSKEREKVMKQAVLGALHDPAKHGDAEQVFQKIVYWSRKCGITIPVPGEELLCDLRLACNGEELGRVRLAVICAQVDATVI